MRNPRDEDVVCERYNTDECPGKLKGLMSITCAVCIDTLEVNARFRGVTSDNVKRLIDLRKRSMAALHMKVAEEHN